MATYISILRGINVSGQKLIKMDELKKSYKDLGFQNVTTYVQSGNVIFNYDETKPNQLEHKIIQQIEKDFGFNITIIVLSVDKLKHIIDNNPFIRDKNKDETHIYITFLADIPNKVDINLMEEKKLDGEEIHIANNAVYLYCPNGYGKTKWNNNFLEKKLKVSATTRNWKTTTELLKIANQIA